MPLHAQCNDAGQQSLLMQFCGAVMLRDESAGPGGGKMSKAAGVHTLATWRGAEAPWVLSRYFSKTMVVNPLSPQWD